MGLFDFLKSKQKYQSENFDELFDKASRDIAYRPLFYQKLLEEELFVLINPDQNIPKGKLVLDKNLSLQIRIWDDGTIPVFTSESKIFDNNIIKEQVQYIAMKGQALFDLFPKPPRLLLNPYSRPSKELLPEEIIQLRTGQLYRSGRKQVIKAGTEFQISLPADDSTELVTLLKSYAGTTSEVKGLYIALIKNIESDEEPHLMIGIKTTRNIKQITGEMEDIIKPYIANGKYIDLIDLSHHSDVAKAIDDKRFRIY